MAIQNISCGTDLLGVMFLIALLSHTQLEFYIIHLTYKNLKPDIQIVLGP